MRYFLLAASTVLSFSLSNCVIAQEDLPAKSIPETKRWPTQTVSVLEVDESTTSSDHLSGKTGDSSSLFELHSFPGAAHFPWLAFDRDGEQIPRDVLTIYEGMKISAESNGNYEIRYQIEAPQTEITVRMQLHFRTSCERAGTITLAPVHIHAEPEEDSNVTSRSFQICQRGHSVALYQAFCELKQDQCNTALPFPPFIRAGTARFGAVPQK